MRKPPVHLVRWSSRLLLLLAIALPISIDAQRDETSRSWNRPVKPFRIISNVYYVGAFEVSAFLITTQQGHILLDSGFAETVPQIRDNLKRLRLKLQNVRLHIVSLAHSDHAAGHAKLKVL